MSSMTANQTFYINSRERISGSDSNFSIRLPLNSHERYDKCVVTTMAVPKSYYLIQAGYNTFTLREEVKIPVEATITIPIGNYSRRSFQSVVQGLLNSGSPSGWTYTVSYPNSAIEADTGKFTYTVSNNTTQPLIICTVNVFECLGFEPNSINTFVGNTLTSTNMIKLQLEDTVFLHSDICSTGHDNILAGAYSAVPDMSVISYVCPDIEACTKSITTVNSNVYNFSITNEDGRVLDLNGRNVVFTLVTYRKDKTMQLVREAIRLSTMEKDLQNFNSSEQV